MARFRSTCSREPPGWEKSFMADTMRDTRPTPSRVCWMARGISPIR